MATTIIGRLYTPEETATGERDIIHVETETDAVIDVNTGGKLSEWMGTINDKTRNATSLNDGLLTATDKVKYDSMLSEKTYVQTSQPTTTDTGCTWIHILRSET